MSDVELPLRCPGRACAWRRARRGSGRAGSRPTRARAGRGPLTADSLAREAQVKAEVRAPAARLEDLAPLLPSALQGRGELALAARAEGTPRAWRGTGTLTSPLVELGPGPLRQLRAAFDLDGTRVDVTELSRRRVRHPHARDGARGPGRAGAARRRRSARRRSPGSRWCRPASACEEPDAPPSRPRCARPRTSRARLAPCSTTSPSAASRSVAGSSTSRRETGCFAPSWPSPSSACGRAAARASTPAVSSSPRRRSRTSISRLSLARSGRLPPRSAARSRPGPRPGCRSPSRGAARASSRSIPSVSSWPVTRGRARAPSRFAGRRVASPSPSSGSPRRRRASSPERQPSARTGSSTLGRPPRCRSPCWPPCGPRFARSEACSISRCARREARPRRPSPGKARFTAATCSCATGRRPCATSRRASACRARACSSGKPRARSEAAASRPGATVALRGWQPGGYRFKLQAQSVAVGQVEGFSSAWDADLELSGITREAQIEGRARLVRGVYSRDLSILSLALSPTRAAAADTGTPLRLRVRVDLDDNLVVRSRIADLRAGGVLSVEGTTARPVVFGSVESRDGRIVFRGRDWSVTNATVRFADPRRLDPFLDVLATSRIGEYDVTMQITGPVSNVTVRFSSTPRLSQNDLLSLVAFGATGADLRESPATVLLGEAGKLLAQNVLGIEPSVAGAAHQHRLLGRQRDRAARLPRRGAIDGRRPLAEHARRRERRRCASSTSSWPPSICPASTTATAVTAPTSCSASASGERRPVMRPPRVDRARHGGAAPHLRRARRGRAPDGHGRRALLLHPLPEEQVRAAIGDLTGKPLSRDAVRDALERLWGLGLFSRDPRGRDPDARRRRPAALRTHRAAAHPHDRVGGHVGHRPRRGRCRRRPRHRGGGLPRRAWPGPSAICSTRYHRDGYLGARVLIRAEPVAGSSERDVTVFLNAGEQARIGVVRAPGRHRIAGRPDREGAQAPRGPPVPGVSRAGRRARRRGAASPGRLLRGTRHRGPA